MQSSSIRFGIDEITRLFTTSVHLEIRLSYVTWHMTMNRSLRRLIRLFGSKFALGAKRFKKNSLLALLCAASFTFCAICILWNFQKMGLSHWDEYYYIETAVWNMNPSYGFFQAYEPPLFPLLLSLMFSVFGIQDYVAIATSEIAGLFLCALTFWWTRREFNLPTAIMSVIVLASTSIFIYYAKMALTDMTYTLFFSAAIFMYYRAIKKRNNSAFLIAGVLLAFTIGTKYTGFQPLLIILIFLLVSRLSTLRGGVSFKKSHSYLRELSNDLERFWWSLAPVSAFVILFLLYLAMPFPILAGRSTLTGNIIQNLTQGLLYLTFTVYPLKAGGFSPQPFVNIDFYGDVVAEFIGLLVIFLAAIGAAAGLLKRQLGALLLLVWAVFIFVFFASLPGTWPRVILPMMVPLSILAGKGLLSCSNAIDRFLHAFGFRKFRKRRIGSLVRVSFVILLIVVHLYSSLPAITNNHSAYRDAAEFITVNFPSRLVFYSTQPVLLTYLEKLGSQSLMVNGLPLLNESYAVVLDFIAEASSDYPQIQARISQMTLALRISNDAGTINMLDSTPFNALRQSDPDRMSIRIYVQSPESANLSTQSYFTPQTGLNLIQSEIGNAALYRDSGSKFVDSTNVSGSTTVRACLQTRIIVAVPLAVSQLATVIS